MSSGLQPPSQLELGRQMSDRSCSLVSMNMYEPSLCISTCNNYPKTASFQPTPIQKKRKTQSSLLQALSVRRGRPRNGDSGNGDIQRRRGFRPSRPRINHGHV